MDILDEADSSFSALVASFLQLDKDDILIDLNAGGGSFLYKLLQYNLRPDQRPRCIIAIGQPEVRTFFDEPTMRICKQFTGTPYEFASSDMFKNLSSDVKAGKVKVFYSVDLHPRRRDPKDAKERVHDIIPDGFYKEYGTLSCWKIANTIAGTGGRAVVHHQAYPLFGQKYSEWRKTILEERLVKSIVELPSGVTPLSGPSVLVLLGGTNEGIDYYLATDLGTSRYPKTPKYFSPKEIDLLVNAQNGSQIRSHVPLEKIRQHDYDLSVYNYNQPTYKSAVQRITPLENLVIEAKKGLVLAGNMKAALSDQVGKYRIVSTADFIGNRLKEPTRKCYLDMDNSRIERCILQPGDILFNRVLKHSGVRSVPDTVHECKLVADQNTLVISPDNQPINRYYLEAFLASDHGQKLVDARRREGHGVLGTLSLSQLLTIEIPIISEQEQQKVAMEYQHNLETISASSAAVENAEWGIAHAFEPFLTSETIRADRTGDVFYAFIKLD